MRATVSAALLVLCAAAAGKAQPSTAEKQAARIRNTEAVRAADERNRAAYADRADVRLARGLVADRAAGQVRLLAEATGLGPGETVEFFLIGEHSGHDYEALAVSFAKPSEVVEALKWLGMAPGTPVDLRALRFWPKGERVKMTFRSPAEPAAFAPVRAERLVMDRRTGKPLPEDGFVFAGSVRAPATDGGAEGLAADIRDPGSIAANYNETESVLDVPRQAPQGQVYESQTVNPAAVLPRGALIEVVIEPEFRDGRRRVVEAELRAAPRPDGPGGTLAGVQFDLAGAPDVALEKAAVDAVLRRFAELAGAGRDLFVTLAPDRALTLGQLRELARMLAAIETPAGIRVEPPRAGDLYYRAFTPDENFRDRAKRIGQPWELHLLKRGEPARLAQIEQVWQEGKLWPDLKVTDYPVAGGADLRRELDAHGPGLPVILVYAEPQVTYGDLMGFLSPVLSTHGTVHVFLPLAEAPAAPPAAPPASGARQ